MTFNECTTSSRREVQDKNTIAFEEHISKRLSFVRKISRSKAKRHLRNTSKHLNLAITKSISNGRHQTLRNIQTCCHAGICAMLYEKKDPVYLLVRIGGNNALRNMLTELSNKIAVMEAMGMIALTRRTLCIRSSAMLYRHRKSQRQATDRKSPMLWRHSATRRSL